MELVESCDGIYSEAWCKRFERELDGFLRGFIGGYSFEVLFSSDGSCNECTSGYSVSETCTRFS